MTSRAFDWTRIRDACQSFLDGYHRWDDQTDAMVMGPMLRELIESTRTVDVPLTWDLVQAVQDELSRAIAKHGRNNTPLWHDRDDGVNLAVLVEEVGEVARAMTYDEGDRDQLRRELIQVAAMAAAWAQALGQVA